MSGREVTVVVLLPARQRPLFATVDITDLNTFVRERDLAGDQYAVVDGPLLKDFDDESLRG